MASESLSSFLSCIERAISGTEIYVETQTELAEKEQLLANMIKTSNEAGENATGIMLRRKETADIWIEKLTEEIEKLKERDKFERAMDAYVISQKVKNTQVGEELDFKRAESAIKLAKVQVKAIKEVDKEEQLYYARSLSGLRGMIKSKIQAHFAEMIAGFTAREISTKGWVGIATASAGAIAAGAIFDALIPQFQTGGLVSGNSHERGGKNINVEGGEFVMSRNAVNAIGVENLNAMNQGSSGGGGVTVNINGGLITPEFVENDLAEAIREGARRGADFTGIS